MPVSFQAEVLDFVEYLVARVRAEEDRDWSELSLACALHGMEDEATLRYTTADLTVVFA